MKKYETLTHVVDIDSLSFTNKLSTKITEYQGQGYQVEVQYQLNQHLFSALILGTKEVDTTVPMF